MSLLKLASDLPTSNKATLVVALGNGSPTIRRISRWLSTTLIIEGTIVPEVSSLLHQRLYSTLMIFNQDLNTLVPASKIRGYLESSQGGLIDTGGSEEIDFENVTSKVTLLSMALTDVTRQIEQEVRAGASDMNAISAQLANLHAKIGEDLLYRPTAWACTLTSSCVVYFNLVDTRAAHLDRSRAKAALQTLAFRVRYQVAAAQDSSLHRGKLQAYWTPTNSQ